MTAVAATGEGAERTRRWPSMAGLAKKQRGKFYIQYVSGGNNKRRSRADAAAVIDGGAGDEATQQLLRIS
ncbi:hypothetical protein ZIOFF_053924 [Zingiber officinale]|uniref:Uncharacterized protein n=1 Tax=Zingiber officinale TaxID=94328 RepID=A0A8J5KD91_ZINOF|nr:hypothetical protein ZIOFF_053924 [Zingiber officinale]